MRAEEYPKLLARNIVLPSGGRKACPNEVGMGDKLLSPKTLELVAERFRLLGEPVRLQILQALRDRELSVGQLVQALSLQQANVSKHLQQLHRAGIVGRRREGLQVFYRILDPSMLDLCAVVCGSLAQELERQLDAVRESGD
jgi:ArsR family transcriptional regulator